MLYVLKPNTLPIPQICSASKTAPLQVPSQGTEALEPAMEGRSPPAIDINDNFPKGRIIKYFPYQRYGYIADRCGREVYFSLSEADFVGVKGSESITVGALVGYDLSRTSNGLHVKRLKIY